MLLDMRPPAFVRQADIYPQPYFDFPVRIFLSVFGNVVNL